MPGRPPRADQLGKVSAGDPIKANEENLLREMAKRHINLPDCLVDSTGVRQAIPRDEAEIGDLVWCRTMEDHPGRGTCFRVIEGVYCEDEGRHRFDCDTATEDQKVAIDWHYTESAGGSIPEPDAGAQGWFKKMPYSWTTDGWIYHVVSLDCDSDGDCETSHSLTDGECPPQASDPCEDESYS